MNIKRLIYAIIAAYVSMSILGFGSHMLLADFMPGYTALEQQGQDLQGYGMLGYLIITIIFCYIYAHNHEDKGWIEGARFGLLIGLMMAGMDMVMYATMPLGARESLLSAGADITIYMVGGIVTSLVYKKDG